MAAILKIQNLTKVYAGPEGEVRAVTDLSLSADAGEFVAVCGPSGCGKSTLLLVAGGLLKPDDGEVVVDGKSLYRLSRGERAALRSRSIGFVFQQFHLIPYLDVLGNVLAPALEGGVNGARERARELIGRFGLTDRSHHVPGQLSTGEKQRTAMARALLNQPRLVLADEPTGNLDHESADAVLTHLREFADDGGAVLLVTHDPRAAQRADRIVQLGGSPLPASPDPENSE